MFSIKLNGVNLKLLYADTGFNRTVKSIILKAYRPSELTSGNGTKQDAAIQPRMAIKAMVSVVEISICKNFFIINVLNWLYRIDQKLNGKFKTKTVLCFF